MWSPSIRLPIAYCFHMSPRMTKPTKWHVHPAKTRISLGICPVWSEPSLSAWRNLGSSVTHWAQRKDSDQTGRMPRLIWVFAWRICHFVGFVMRWSICVFLLYLRHDSRNKGMKHSWKNIPPFMGIEPGSSRIKIQCSNHWAKESTPCRNCQRLNIYLEAMRNLPRQIIEGRSARP